MLRYALSAILDLARHHLGVRSLPFFRVPGYDIVYVRRQWPLRLSRRLVVFRPVKATRD